MSIGKAGAGRDPAVTEAEHHVIKTALSMGIQPRAETGSPDDTKRYLDMGVRHFCMGTDMGILFNLWEDYGSSLKAEIDDVVDELG
jgi:4-hydroxy-2-oxoheptanedioate aldolase